MQKTLYITDLDGTLLRLDATLSDFTKSAINSLVEQGILFSFATARSFISAGRITEGLNLKAPIAAFNGAFIVDPKDGGYIDRCLMEQSRIEPLMEIVRARELSVLVYAFVGGAEKVSWLRGKESPGVLSYIDSRKGDKRLRPVDDYDSLFEGEMYYLTLIGTKDEAEVFYDLVRADPYFTCTLQKDIYNKEEYWVELYRHDASKASAVQKIKAITGADKVVCFGDNLNDLPMFEVCDEAYAVSNAVEQLKQIATGVIGANDDDGVVRWLLEHMKEEC